MHIKSQVVSDSEFCNKDMSYSVVHYSDFNRMNMFGIILHHSQFINCTFRNCDFSYADLSSCDFIDCIFHDCVFYRANIENCKGLVYDNIRSSTFKPFLFGGSVVYWTEKAIGDKRFIVNYYEDILLEDELNELEERFKAFINRNSI
jgi:hypothetical protein